jgi:uracil phosphoribosyltransferase
MSLLVLDHPLIADRMTRLREESTDRAQFRALVAEISGILTYEACRALPTRLTAIRTPMGSTSGRRLHGPGPVVVPILRAGLGMLDAVLSTLASGDAAPLGLRRNERTLVASVYADTVPHDLRGMTVVVCDPMLATGGSMAFACNLAAERGAGEIIALSLIAAPEGLARVATEAPQARVAVAAVDERLDERGFIVPGLGDAGDRLYGPPAPFGEV